MYVRNIIWKVGFKILIKHQVVGQGVGQTTSWGTLEKNTQQDI
jgi:hypothetical protein